MKHTICSVGDMIHTSRIPADYAPIGEIIKRADARLFNLENVLSDAPAYGSSYCGGMWFTTKESYLDNTLKLGFNGCSSANNHSMDDSYEGVIFLNDQNRNLRKSTV